MNARRYFATYWLEGERRGEIHRNGKIPEPVAFARRWKARGMGCYIGELPVSPLTHTIDVTTGRPVAIEGAA